MIDRRAGRRGVLAVLGFLGVAGRAAAAVPTPEQTAGPFYPPPNQRPQDTDWDLVKVEGRVRQAGGEVMHLSGRVVGRNGAPLAEALVEIWQCDANGRYHHVGDRSSDRPLDEAFHDQSAQQVDRRDPRADIAVRNARSAGDVDDHAASGFGTEVKIP